MSLAVREVSVEKGYDPRDFALVASGGAGPLHVMAIARELYVPTVIVPLFPSHFSALGMLLADERHDLIRTHYADLARLDFAALAHIHDEMAKEAEAQLRQKKDAQFEVQLDLRYVGQEFTLSVPVPVAWIRSADRAAIRGAFDRALRAALCPSFARRAGRARQHPPRRHRQAPASLLSRACGGRSSGA